jgi:hypothetical protein
MFKANERTIPAFSSVGRKAVIVLAYFAFGLMVLYLPVRQSQAAEATVFDLEIIKRQVKGGAPTLRVSVGDDVRLRWRTDEKVEIHLHGYDLKLILKPGASQTLAIDARIAGRFPISAHDFGHKNLAYLEVHPK